jgi:hypothetical protein
MFARTARCVALAACFASLVGCAEVNYRGGFVAEVEDWVLFRAVTKSHRLLRSYILTASFTALARNSHLGDVEKGAVSGRLKQALSIIEESYYCLYPYRGKLGEKGTVRTVPEAIGEDSMTVKLASCIFFDNRMAQLDYALYKLAAEVLLDPESSAGFANVRDRLAGEIPVLGKALKAATKAVDATNDAAGAVFDATSLLNALVRISHSSAGRWIYIGPIYRDVLEFDMRLVLHTLQYRCGLAPQLPQIRRIKDDPMACAALDEGSYIFNRGNGDMRAWRETSSYRKTAFLMTSKLILFTLHS